MKKATILISTMLCFLLLGCTSGPLTEKDNKSTVEYALDTPFHVELKSNHESQNKWSLISDNSPCITVEEVNVTTEDDIDTFSFKFLVKSTGKEKVVIAYGNENEQSKIFELNVLCGTLGVILSD